MPRAHREGVSVDPPDQAFFVCDDFGLRRVLVSRAAPGPATEMMSSRARSGELEKAALQFRVGAHAAHVYLREGKAFCFMSGPDAVRKAREAVSLPFDA